MVDNIKPDAPAEEGFGAHLNRVLRRQAMSGTGEPTLHEGSLAHALRGSEGDIIVAARADGARGFIVTITNFEDNGAQFRALRAALGRDLPKTGWHMETAQGKVQIMFDLASYEIFRDASVLANIEPTHISRLEAEPHRPMALQQQMTSERPSFSPQMPPDNGGRVVAAPRTPPSRNIHQLVLNAVIQEQRALYDEALSIYEEALRIHEEAGAVGSKPRFDYHDLTAQELSVRTREVEAQLQTAIAGKEPDEVAEILDQFKARGVEALEPRLPLPQKIIPPAPSIEDSPLLPIEPTDGTPSRITTRLPQQPGTTIDSIGIARSPQSGQAGGVKSAPSPQAQTRLSTIPHLNDGLPPRTAMPADIQPYRPPEFPAMQVKSIPANDIGAIAEVAETIRTARPLGALNMVRGVAAEAGGFVGGTVAINGAIAVGIGFYEGIKAHDAGRILPVAAATMEDSFGVTDVKRKDYRRAGAALTTALTGLPAKDALDATREQHRMLHVPLDMAAQVSATVAAGQPLGDQHLDAIAWLKSVRADYVKQGKPLKVHITLSRDGKSIAEIGAPTGPAYFGEGAPAQYDTDIDAKIADEARLYLANGGTLTEAQALVKQAQLKAQGKDFFVDQTALAKLQDKGWTPLLDGLDGTKKDMAISVSEVNAAFTRLGVKAAEVDTNHDGHASAREISHALNAHLPAKPPGGRDGR